MRQRSGRPIVLLHGWSQCAEEFKHQIELLSAKYDVTSVDQQSHDESQKVSYGLKISRLAKDLYELLTGLDRNEVSLLGHSMGSSVIWWYFDLFGPERLSQIILVDQSPFLISGPHWTLNNSIYRDNARKLQKAIAEANGLSVAADLVEESLGVTRDPGRA